MRRRRDTRSSVPITPRSRIILDRRVLSFGTPKSPLIVASCLPPARLERLGEAIETIPHDIRSAERSSFTISLRSSPPDIIVVDPSHLAIGEVAATGGSWLTALSMIAPSILWLHPSAVGLLRPDPGACYAEWLIAGVDDDVDSIRAAIVRACAQLPARIVIAIEPRLQQLPFEVAEEIRIALQGTTPEERRGACAALQSRKASTLRGQLARASLGRLREIRRVARLWSAYECIRLGDQVHVAASKAGYRSERSLLNDSCAVLGCSSSGLARVTCGRFLAAAVTMLDRLSIRDRNESLSA